MKVFIRYFNFCLLAMTLTFNACKTVPLTGRSQLSLISSTQMLSLSSKQYSDFIKSHKLSGDTKNTKRVKNVGKRIQKAVEKFAKANGFGSDLRDYKWQFNLIEDDRANAWAMPGGKVVVYTGILKYTKDDDGLAVVLGHEIAHAIAHHGEERASQELARKAGGLALSAILNGNSQLSKSLWMNAYGIGTQIGIMLPFSREHESEADHLGLIFMSMAGFDPHTAPVFWKRFMHKKGKTSPEFFSTHPSTDKRIEQIQSWMPEAMAYYKK